MANNCLSSTIKALKNVHGVYFSVCIVWSLFVESLILKRGEKIIQVFFKI